jgi:hypothetical protein
VTLGVSRRERPDVAIVHRSIEVMQVEDAPTCGPGDGIPEPGGYVDLGARTRVRRGVGIHGWALPSGLKYFRFRACI